MSLAIVNDPKLGSKLGDDSPQATTDPGFAGLHLPFKIKAITLETPTLTHYVDPRIARDWRAADLLPEPVINPVPMPQHVGSVTHHAPPDTVRRDAHRGPTQTSTEARGTQQRGKDGTGYVGGVDRSGENR